MARNIGMPRKGDFPGLQRSKRKDGTIALHWVASRVAIAAGYPVKTVRLHGYMEGSPELADRCQDLQAQMSAWLADQSRADKPIVFNGTIGGLIKLSMKPCPTVPTTTKPRAQSGSTPTICGS